MNKGIPISVIGQGKNLKVDAIAFLEFKERLLYKFAASRPVPFTNFRVIISRKENLKNNNLQYALNSYSAYRLNIPPGINSGIVAFITKNSPLDKEIRSRLSKNKPIFANVELEFNYIEDSKYKLINIVDIPSFSWSLEDFLESHKNLKPVNEI